eukprot:4094427-Pyramimonas_sp.AAC.1
MLVYVWTTFYVFVQNRPVGGHARPTDRHRKLEHTHCQWRAAPQSQGFLRVEADAGVVWCILGVPDVPGKQRN